MHAKPQMRPQHPRRLWIHLQGCRGRQLARVAGFSVGVHVGGEVGMQPKRTSKRNGLALFLQRCSAHSEASNPSMPTCAPLPLALAVAVSREGAAAGATTRAAVARWTSVIARVLRMLATTLRTSGSLHASEICPGPRKAVPRFEAGEPPASSANPVCPPGDLPLHRQRRVRPIHLFYASLESTRSPTVDLLHVDELQDRSHRRTMTAVLCTFSWMAPDHADCICKR